jgi:O-antigen/teichoic acid export membrane protein
MSSPQSNESTPDPSEPSGLPAQDSQLEPYGEGPLIGRLVTFFRKESVRTRLLAPLGADTLILVTNLVTGVIVARALGPSGRGELVALLMFSQISAWVFGLGSSEAISYFQSRHPELASKLQSSWLIAAFPISVVGIGAAELLLPVLFAAQTHQAISYGRLYLAVIPLIILQGIFNGSVLADEEFNFFNVTRFVAPALIAVGYLILLAAGTFSVSLALTTNFVSTGVIVVILGRRVLKRHPLVRPDLQLLRRSVSFGLKAHAGSLGSLVNARLDLVIIPAFLSASSVGLYSVATNVGSILPVLTGTVALMLLPVAARRQGSARTVILTMQATMVISLAVALPLAVLAPLALKLIYGSGFDGAVEPLRLLLPGVVAQAGSTVLWSGLLAAERPFLASLAIAPAAVVTIVGLIIFLPLYGINAAAIITSVVYFFELTGLAIFYRRTLRIRWRDYVFPPAT